MICPGGGRENDLLPQTAWQYVQVQSFQRTLKSWYTRSPIRLSDPIFQDLLLRFLTVFRD